MAECPICAAEVELPEDTLQGELIECNDCATELEVKEIKPYKLEEAPKEEEDWGE